MQPRLKRSATESMVAGVCGGLAEYFNIDPVIVRLIFVVVTLTSGLGLPAYLILWLVMPRAAPAGSRQPSEHAGQHARAQGAVALQETPVAAPDQFAGHPPGAEQPAPPPGSPAQPERRHARWRTLGLILIGIGGLVLLDQFGIDTSLLFPALLIVAGVILLQRQR